MAIPSGILNYPNVGRRPSSMTFSLMSNTTAFQSPIGASTQTIETPGAYWKGTVNYTNLLEDQAGILKAFLISLRGMSGRFWFGDISSDIHSDLSNTLLNIGWNIHRVINRSRVELQCVAAIASGDTLMRAGDYIAFNYKYQVPNSSPAEYVDTQSIHMVTSNAVTASQRLATINFQPALRTTPVLTQGTPRGYLTTDDQSAIDQVNVVAPFRLEKDSVSWGVSPPNFTNLQFSFMEAFS